VSDTQTDLVAVLLVLLVRSVMDNVTTTGFAGSVVRGALKLNVDAVPAVSGRAGPTVEERSSTGSVGVAVGVHRDQRAIRIARFNAASRVQWILERDLGVLITGTSELNRIWPNKAGTAP